MKKDDPDIVLGMHRSGTSAVANILHCIGISMGQKFLEADQFNPDGYYEDEAFVGINKGIIENSGGTWYTPPSISEIQEGGKKFEDSISATVKKKRRLSANKSWGWKDPRNCLTCWSYVHAVPDARFIVVVRTPKNINRSLNATHGHKANWDNVVEQYYASITQFLATRDNPAINICFETLVYEQYAKAAVQEILDFVNKPDRLLERAMSVINFR